MSDHQGLRDLLAAVALGAATDHERDEVERHAATCHACRDELDELRSAVGALAVDVPQLDPPTGLRDRVLDAARADSSARRPVPVRPSRRGRFGWPAIAGALAAAVVGLTAWNLSFDRDDGATARIVEFAGTPAAPELRGRVEVGADGIEVMRVQGLAPLPPDQGYELWSIRDGQAPRSEGFAAVTATGEVVVATDVPAGTTLAITPERRTNVAAPSTEPLVAVLV